MTIKRYDVVGSHNANSRSIFNVAIESVDGVWVKYEDLKGIRAQAVREYFGKLATEYDQYGLKCSYTAFDVARHINAQASYYADKIERGEV